MSNQVRPPFWTLPPREDGVDENPRPPPASVVEVLPAFHSHGEHNCGDHRYDLCCSGFKKHLERQRKDASSAWNLACSNCHLRLTLNRLHDLPCGDLLCCGCLNARALKIQRSLERNKDQILASRIEMCDVQNRINSKHFSGLDARSQKELSTRYRALEKRVLSLAGLTCCGGVKMKLDRFLACLRPEASRQLWLVYQWMQDPLWEHRACAWPDCNAYLPSCCRYEVPDSASYWHWYCVTCQANSMECSRDLLAPQSRFPWLSRGHPALTPCR
ncbi:hypothetical protein VTK26DRAFT_1447 [Humicola hyalothermophila]